MSCKEEDKNGNQKILCITGTKVGQMDAEQLTKITITVRRKRRKRRKRRAAACPGSTARQWGAGLFDQQT